MKRTLLIVSIIGLFMATTPDLQARHRSKVLPRLVRGGIAIALLSQIQLHNHHNGYDGYQYRQGRQIAKEIRGNEKRIFKLEKRINRLGRYKGSYREIRELEREIDWLARRNNYLRSQL